MKKAVLFFAATLMLLFLSNFAQAEDDGLEILYFKANLACCKARACNSLQTDVESVLKTYFENEKINFKVIRLSDPANDELVKKYNAKSQTVVIVNKKGNNEHSEDISSLVQQYARDNDKSKFEENMKNKIKETLAHRSM